MGDRLERTDVWQQYHDRVTAEVPVIVSDGENHDMFRKALEAEMASFERALDAEEDVAFFGGAFDNLKGLRSFVDPMHDDDPTPRST